MKTPNILIADDDRGMRSALRVLLEAWGYRVVEAPDGLSVVAQYLRKDIAAIILDHAMPNGDGRSVARMIRNECDTPIIFLSGYDREEFRETVYELPDTYYLPKPLEHEKLHELLLATTVQHKVSNVV